MGSGVLTPEVARRNRPQSFLKFREEKQKAAGFREFRVEFRVWDLGFREFRAL